MILPRKGKPTQSLTDMVGSGHRERHLELIAKRELMWEAWIDECVMWDEACIEGALNVFPSLQVAIGPDDH